ncbi:MAG: hypothetical protein EOO42_04370 [Flavobacteriales bacterium]|nr:MAG: hypothetical protein EOO42_04370 [Flavobacteriales bacterium]
MPTYYNNILCISYGELVNKTAAPNVVGDDALMSHYDYTNLTKEQKVTIRRGCNNTPALYQFDKLPAKVRNAASKKYEIDKVAKQEPLKQLLVNDYTAYAFFSKYVKSNGENLKANTIREYTATATALNAIIKLMNDSKAWRKALGGTPSSAGALSNLSAILKTLQPTYGWKLPASDRGLRGKIAKYKQLGYEGLISGKEGNDNASKITEDAQEAALRRIMALGRNLDDVQVMKLYNVAADTVGWKKITKGTVANRRSEWQMYADAGARGKSHHENTHAMQFKRKAPSSPLFYWTLDGWDAELLYQQVEIDRKGYSKTTYHNRLTVVVVLDPCQKYPIGYAVGDHETPELIRSAIRNAVKHTAELFGEMYHVHQLQSDNYSKKKLTPFYESLSEYYTPARVKNAKAKVIEPYFKSLNKNFCQLQANWSGYGVTARKENQPNAEYLNKIRHSFPDLKGCIAQIDAMIAGERAAKREAYLNAWTNLSDDLKLKWTHEEYLHNIGEVYGRSNRLEGSGIIKTINGETFNYESFDASFRKHRNTDWILKCDPENMTTVLAENEDATLRFMLTEKYVQPMALIERTEGDGKQLAAVNQFNKSLVNDILQVQQKDFDVLGDFMHQHPALEDTLGKLLLVDSNGQHKDNKSSARLSQAAKRIEIKEVKKQEKRQELDAENEQDAYIAGKFNFNDFLK